MDPQERGLARGRVRAGLGQDARGALRAALRCDGHDVLSSVQSIGMARSTVSCWLALTVCGVEVTSTLPEGVKRTSTM